MLKKNKAVTLAELMISLSLLGVISIGIWSIDRFIHFQLINANRRAKIYRDVSYVIEHMVKTITGPTEAIGGAIGDVNNPPVDIRWLSGSLVKIYTDRNANGRRDDTSAGDVWIAYRHFAAWDQYHGQLWYYSNCEGPDCEFSTRQPSCLSYKVRTFNLCDETTCYSPANNYIPVYIKLCWDPYEFTGACGGFENPAVDMRFYIKMPGVSAH